MLALFALAVFEIIGRAAVIVTLVGRERVLICAGLYGSLAYEGGVACGAEVVDAHFFLGAGVCVDGVCGSVWKTVTMMTTLCSSEW